MTDEENKLMLEDYKKWIEDHTKTWLENAIETQLSHPFSPSCSNYDVKKICFKNGAKEVCKKILEEVEKHSIYGTELIRDIIKNLGVEV